MRRLRASFRPALLGLGLSLAAVACGDDDPSGTGGAGGSGGSGSTTTTTTTTATTTTTTGGEGGGQGGGTTSGTGGEGGGQGGAGGGGGEGGAPPEVWVTPACAEVEGLEGAVTFTTDQGDTLTPRSASMSGISYSWSLVALDTPNTLLAAHDGTLLRSTDAGCTWASVAPLPATLVHLQAAKGGVAYGFEENGRAFFRIEGDVVENLSANVPFANGPVRGVGLDADDPDHLRMADETGAIWDSTDGGMTWEQVGDAAPYQCFYTVKFDPNDLEHAICGTVTYGAWVTFDGGFAWQEATGDALYSQVFQVAISPVDGDVAWAIGHENGLHDGEVIGEDLKHLWRSTDGGLTWESIADERTVVTGDGDRPDIINGNPLYAHPTDADVAYYTFGMPPLQGENFAELFRVDAADGSVTVETHTGGDIDDYGAIAFHPTDPSVIYLALTSERPGGGF